jgi:hypothetical protein
LRRGAGFERLGDPFYGSRSALRRNQTATLTGRFRLRAVCRTMLAHPLKVGQETAASFGSKAG